MNAAEFRNEFDILYNNIMSNAAPPVNAYEISVFLTKAQEEIVKSYCLGRPNMFRSADLNEDSKEILRPLYKQFKEVAPTEVDAYNTFKIFKVEQPSDLFYIQQESVQLNTESPCLINRKLIVIPTPLDKLHKLLANPHKSPNTKRAFRVEWYEGESGIFLVNGSTLKNYSMIYVKKPSPIVVEDISSYGVTVDGISSPLTPVCELPDMIHREIVNRAVELAKSTYMGDLSSTIALNSRNQ